MPFRFAIYNSLGTIIKTSFYGSSYVCVCVRAVLADARDEERTINMHFYTPNILCAQPPYMANAHSFAIYVESSLIFFIIMFVWRLHFFTIYFPLPRPLLSQTSVLSFALVSVVVLWLFPSLIHIFSTINVVNVFFFSISLIFLRYLLSLHCTIFLYGAHSSIVRREQFLFFYFCSFLSFGSCAILHIKLNNHCTHTPCSHLFTFM